MWIVQDRVLTFKSVQFIVDINDESLAAGIDPTKYRK